MSRDIGGNIKKMIHDFFAIFFISFSAILLIAFLVNSIDYFSIISRALIISFLYILVAYLSKKIGTFFPLWLFIFSLLLVLVTFILSSTENYRVLDKILGIDGLSEKILKGEILIKHTISQPIIYEKYKTAQKDFENKIEEFNKSIEYLELKIHENINKLRVNYNLSVLKFDNKLREIARYHSRDMAENDYFDHISLSGETLSDRFKKFDYWCKIEIENRVYTGAENLFLGYIYKSYSYDKLTGKIVSYDFYDLEEFVEEVVRSWYNSYNHRMNILFPYWKNEGIGIFITKEGKVYITQVFC